jgi:hypothetical protein
MDTYDDTQNPHPFVFPHPRHPWRPDLRPIPADPYAEDPYFPDPYAHRP